jgi:hypothetical protein
MAINKEMRREAEEFARKYREAGFEAGDALRLAIDHLAPYRDITQGRNQ